MSRLSILLVLLALLVHIRAQSSDAEDDFVRESDGPCIDPVVFRPPPFLQQSVFGFSRSAPMYQVLREDPQYVSATQQKIDFLQRLDSEIQSRNPADDPEQDEDDLLRVCNFRGPGWTNGVRNFMGYRGFPPPSLSCITDFEGTQFRKDGEKMLSESQLLQSVRQSNDALDNNLNALIDAIVPSWPSGAILRAFPLESGSAVCTIDFQGAARIQNVWYLMTTFQNTPISQFNEKFGRQVVVELHTATNNSLLPTKNVCVPGLAADGTAGDYQTDYTTILGKFRGTGEPAVFSVPGTRAQHPAAALALEKADEFLQQAEDATTPSNIAIIMLPLALNLVPIALVADVSTTVLLAYALLSDVLTVIPLGIKGVELIMIGNQRVIGAVTRMSSATDRERSDTAAAEIWVAECKARDNVKPTGITFIVLAIVFLIGGIVGEFVARKFAAKRRARRRTALQQREYVIPGAQNAYLRNKSMIERAFSSKSDWHDDQKSSLMPKAVDDGMVEDDGYKFS